MKEILRRGGVAALLLLVATATQAETKKPNITCRLGR